MTSIGNLLQGDVVTFIKMDVEGTEHYALKGAESTIRNHRPLLAISVYHKPEDLLTILQLLQSFCPDYHFFLRGHHPELAFELASYAVPDERNLG
ncbi:FkbM family methyltransferase [Pseudescherichia sp.]|uniref:FkbM family methyltransferase n=1 Tax=Pseudescherichia sp. TaxID=2055881 RepID=UPI003917499A